jgi:hypothetical protein
MAVVSIKNKLRRGNLLVGNEAYDPAGMVPIATTVVGSGGAASVTFSSIPSTYAHLQIRLFTQSARANSIDFFNMRVNSDTGSNYAYHGVYGSGSSVGTVSGASDSKIDLSTWSASSATSIFGAAVVDILDYNNTNKYKTIRFLGNYDANGSGQVQLWSGLWMNTNAITGLSFYFGNGNIAQYSHFALYGIKSA